MSLEQWKEPDKWSIEDEFLFQYWQDVGGLIVTEVFVGGKGPQGQWPKGTKPRRIDGVRVVPDPLNEMPTDIITYSKLNAGEFAEAVTGTRIEVIEVKEKLGRYVIGQVIIGADMMELEYDVAGIDQVIVCKVGDPLLESLCKQRGIKVWISTE
jgi:hypothetical protein